MGYVANFLGHMTYSHWDWNFIKFDEMRYSLRPKMVKYLKKHIYFKIEPNLTI